MHGECINMLTTYKCKCDRGYRDMGRLFVEQEYTGPCIDVNECMDMIMNPKELKRQEISLSSQVCPLKVFAETFRFHCFIKVWHEGLEAGGIWVVKRTGDLALFMKDLALIFLCLYFLPRRMQ